MGFAHPLFMFRRIKQPVFDAEPCRNHILAFEFPGAPPPLLPHAGTGQKDPHSLICKHNVSAGLLSLVSYMISFK